MYVSTPKEDINHDGLITNSSIKIGYSSTLSSGGGDTWDSSYTYWEGQVVLYNGSIYQALQGIPGNPNVNKIPDQTLNQYWNFIAVNTLPVSSYPPYNINSIVFYNNKVYKSLINNNSTLGGDILDPTKWQVIDIWNELKQFDENNSTYTLNHLPYLEYQINDSYNVDEKLRGLSFTGLENVNTIVVSAIPNPNTDYFAASDSLIPLDPIYDIKEWTSTNTVVDYNFVYYSFNKLLNKIWRANKDAQNKTTAIIKLYSKTAIEAFEIITGDYLDAHPKGLIISASNNNGVSWTTIYSNSNLNLPDDLMTKSKPYYTKNKTPYLWYKLEFLNSKNTNISYIDINEITLLYRKNSQLNGTWKTYSNVNTNIVGYNASGAAYTSINNSIISSLTTNGDVSAGETIDNCFDSNVETKWYTAVGYFEESPYWLQATISLQTPICVQLIQFITANDMPSRDPTNYIIFGSNNGNDWSLLNSRNIELPFQRNTAGFIYPINNLNSYLYYHIVFSNQKDKTITYTGEANYQLSEIKLLYDPLDPQGSALREYNGKKITDFKFITNNDEITVFIDGESNSIYYTTSDPRQVNTWTLASIPLNPNIVINSLSYENEIFFATVTNTLTNSGQIWVSSTGKSWNIAQVFISSAPTTLTNVVYCDSFNKYVTLTSDRKVLTSINGYEWVSDSSHTIPGTTPYLIATNYVVKKIAWSKKQTTLAVVGSGSATGYSGPTVFLTKDLYQWDLYNDWTRPSIEANLVEIKSDNDNGFYIGGYKNVYNLEYYNHTWNFWRVSTYIFNSQNILDGTINSIVYNPLDGAMYFGGGGTTAYTSNLSPIIYKLDISANSTPSLIELNSTKSTIGGLHFNDKYGHLMAGIGPNILMNSPIYYEKRNLKVKNTTKVNKTATFIPENIAAEYSKINFKVQMYGSYNMKIANCILTSNNYYLGEIQRGLNINLIDYSIKNTDEFGNMTIVERTYGDKINLQTIINVEDINNIKNLLNKIRSSICVWNVSKDITYDKLNFYGYYRNYSISIDNPKLAKLQIELESLVY